MNDKLNVWIICGGRSAEHEVSLRSARSIAAALDREKYDLHFVTITKEGKWVSTTALEGRMVPPLRDASPHWEGAAGVPAVSEGWGALVARISPAEPDRVAHPAQAGMVAFPVLHGPYGEDGTIQGFFEMLDIPYVGSGVLGSALAMDKAKTKEMLFHNGIPVPHWVSLGPDRDDARNRRIRDIVWTVIGYPCFVKPANLGSSIGVTKVHNCEELEEAIEVARNYDAKVLIEEGIDAREIECSVLGNGAALASLPGEVIPGREFYDYDAKYYDDATELVIPADLTAEQVKRVQHFALRAFHTLECYGMARVDFFLEKRTGRVLVNELNTIPGFTEVSMYPKLWEATGIPYPELLDRLIELALERYEEKRRLSVDRDCFPPRAFSESIVSER
jgi:D-alanine-D-alanine ligase